MKARVEEIVREKHQEALQDPQVRAFATQLKRLVESVGVEASQKLLKEHHIDVSVEQVVQNVCNVMPETRVNPKLSQAGSGGGIGGIGLNVRFNGEGRRFPLKEDQPELICAIKRVAGCQELVLTLFGAEYPVA